MLRTDGDVNGLLYSSLARAPPIFLGVEYLWFKFTLGRCHQHSTLWRFLILKSISSSAADDRSVLFFSLLHLPSIVQCGKRNENAIPVCISVQIHHCFIEQKCEILLEQKMKSSIFQIQSIY